MPVWTILRSFLKWYLYVSRVIFHPSFMYTLIDCPGKVHMFFKAHSKKHSGPVIRAEFGFVDKASMFASGPDSVVRNHSKGWWPFGCSGSSLRMSRQVGLEMIRGCCGRQRRTPNLRWHFRPSGLPHILRSRRRTLTVAKATLRRFLLYPAVSRKTRLSPHCTPSPRT